MLENDTENKATNVDDLLENDTKNKIANVEGLLKGELATVTSLKCSTEDSKSYLMNTLEKLSSNFSSDDIVEDAHMLPQFFKTLNDSLAKVDSNLIILKDLENSINSILFSISLQYSTNTIDLDELDKQLNLYNLKKMESKNDILNNSTYVERFISSAKPIINDLTETIDNSKENIIKQFKENRDNAVDKTPAIDTSNTNEITAEKLDCKTIVIEKCDNNECNSNESVSNEFNNNDSSNKLNGNEFINDSNSHDSNNNKKDSILYKPYKINENDTLLISEKQEKVFLPYSLQDLAQFTKDADKSVEDVIRENFIIPISTFKNPTISRFKEAFNLAKNKSKCSLLKSFNFAVEIMFKYSLNPAIIVACKNVDELKDYLNCLKEQKLDLFKAFKIKYEINPMKI